MLLSVNQRMGMGLGWLDRLLLLCWVWEVTSDWGGESEVGGIWRKLTVEG